jgi:preprotein translocase subunit SecY
VADLGKLLVFLGAGIVIVGVVFVLLGRINLPIGRLPGDIVYRGKNTTFYFPLATSVLASVVISVLMYLIGKMRK